MDFRLGEFVVAVDPNKLTDPSLIRNLLNNAKAVGRDDLVLQCQVRLARLAGAEFADPLVREFWAAVTAAEEIATQINGKTTRLSRTRQKEKRVGPKRCLEDWANDPNVTKGFELLVSGGHPELTGEAIVLRHEAEFSATSVASARAKLKKHGVDFSMLTIAPRGS